ncbi:MAG: hypothetical protein ABIJ65_15335 [Chloroflexota bacterium]
MKKMILVMVFASLMLTTGCNQILQVRFVMPSFLEPYYEWIIKFPDLQSDPFQPAPTEMWKENNAAINLHHISYNLMIY